MGKLVDDIATGKSVNSDDGIVGPGDVGIMKTSCVSYDTFDARESKRVLPEEQSLVACPVEAKTLIVSRMNTPDRVGACGFVADNWPNLFLPDRLWRVRLRNSVDPYLVYVLLTSDGSKKVLRGMASGTSGSMHNIPKESFLDMELALPTSLEEQSKIAKQFASLDKLITLHQCTCPIFYFCAHGSRANFASTPQGQLRVLRYPRPIPKMLVSPSSPVSGVFDTIEGARGCGSSSAIASTPSPSARKNPITSPSLCCRDSLSSP